MYFFRHLATVLFLSSFSINVTVFARGFALENSRLSASNEATEASHVVIRNQRKDNKRRLGIDFRNRGRHIAAAVNPRSPVNPAGGHTVPSGGHTVPTGEGTVPTSEVPTGEGTDPNGEETPPKEKDGDPPEDDPHGDKRDPPEGSESHDSSEGSEGSEPHEVPDSPNTTACKATPTSSHRGTSIHICSSKGTSPAPAASSSSDPPATSPILSTTPTLALATSTVSSSPAASATAARSSGGNPLILGTFENGRKWGFAVAGFLFYFSVNFFGL